ncbi:peptide chain release factor N(5)-glutamine methyltransferase [Brachybacterium phenoliresistens]|uniref:peptide chain release factor N(5)-glutamine methyltransferase n=1 Tax=Brachybacterium phenoliresistens TaxID=396014 RepID=Z9JZ07_9MICO|nr:peptide chain release factor N(5)-glutamine methyltransferase [Brachybacterium phenoliresistens]EWS83007.1 protein-(glutamine-N5) methyltransferase [Brachybacterium phenoliresistens]
MSLPVPARLRTALGEVSGRLAAAGVPSPTVDARALIARAAGEPAHLVLLDALPDGFDAHLEELTRRREAREPLQLILGSAPFRRLQLEVAAGVFIPRPETEVALDVLLEHARTEHVAQVLDLCTGSGAIAAAVLDEMPGVRVLAVERDPAAARLAARNIAAAGGDRGTVLQGDVREVPIEPGVDAVLSNPPYIPAGQVPRDPEVLAHDPEAALYGGGEDGLQIPRAIIVRAARLLRPGGLLVMEHADVQGPATCAIAQETGAFEQVRTRVDLTGRDRFLVAVRRQAEVRD